MLAVLTLMFSLSELGIDIAPLIASAGVLGLAIGFGAQNLVRDFVTGVFMLLEDQYGVGDIVDLGEARILAVLHDSHALYGIGAISVINRYFGRDGIPLGAYTGPVGAPGARSSHPEFTNEGQGWYARGYRFFLLPRSAGAPKFIAHHTHAVKVQGC